MVPIPGSTRATRQDADRLREANRRAFHRRVDEMLDYWGGSTWVWHGTIVNDGVTSGSHIYSVVPGEGNEMEILYGDLLNGDTGARAVDSFIRDGDSVPNQHVLAIPAWQGLSATAGQHMGFPATDEVTGGGKYAALSNRWILSGIMELFMRVNSVAVNENTAFSIVARIRGEKPTVTFTTPPSGSTTTVLTDRVYL